MDTKNLRKISKEVRKDIIKMIYKANSGHPLGSLSSVEMFVALYFGIMNHHPKKPRWPLRDRLFVSHGHVCPAQYSVMAEAGYFPKAKLNTYAKLGSSLQGHPERKKLAGIEITSGSLGFGLAQAAGYALASRTDDKRFRVYCMTSDGEHDEGNHWEAILFTAKQKLSNLTLFVDRNRIQIGGPTKEVLSLGSLAEKYEAFGWNAIKIDGHDFEEIFDAVDEAKAHYQGPSVIIAETVAGKGVSFIEGKASWHAKHPNKEERDKALEEIKNG